MIGRAARLVSIGVATFVVASTVVRAQSAVTRPTFEVTSIKQSTNPNDGGSAGFRPGGTFVATNVAAGSLVYMAYRTNPPLLPQQIAAMPPWAQVTRYDITAKVSPDAAGNMTALYAAQSQDVRSLHRQTD